MRFDVKKCNGLQLSLKNLKPYPNVCRVNIQTHGKHFSPSTAGMVTIVCVCVFLIEKNIIE